MCLLAQVTEDGDTEVRHQPHRNNIYAFTACPEHAVLAAELAVSLLEAAQAQQPLPPPRLAQDTSHPKPAPRHDDSGNKGVQSPHKKQKTAELADASRASQETKTLLTRTSGSGVAGSAGQSPFFSTLLTGSKVAEVRALLAAPGLNLSAKYGGNTVLHEAASHAALPAFRAILGACESTHVRAANDEGDTPLHLVASDVRAWQAAKVRLLLDARAPLFATNVRGLTPLDVLKAQPGAKKATQNLLQKAMASAAEGS